MTVLVEMLIKENPKFHKLPSGLSTSWAVSSDVLKFIYSGLTSDMVTLETGAGQTTVVFAIAGTKHTCITPSKYEASRIKQYCQKLGIESSLTFLTESSDMVLPRHELIPPKLDFVFIDGAHHFPFPCIDWHYTERKLKVGGILGVDDFKIPSVRVLFDFLSVEEEWELIKIVRNAAFFRKVREPDEPYYWRSQKFNSNNESWQKKSLTSRVKAWVVKKWRTLS